MKKNKLLVGLTSAVMLANGTTAVVAETTDTAVEVCEQTAVEYHKVANVQGSFRFDQNVLSPASDVFNLFGTAATAMCAKPAYAFDDADADYYVNIGGTMKQDAKISASAIKEMDGQARVMKCSCSTSKSIINANVKGVALSDIVAIDELDSAINAVTVESADGYSKTLPLRLAVQNGAMLVYSVNGQELTNGQGAPLQLWMPKAAANYFVRRVANIEFSALETEPTLETPVQHAKVGIMNELSDRVVGVGETLTFEGYADDCDIPVSAVEFSLDGGETWTSCPTENASADRWVYWYFDYTPTAEGDYRMDVRARTENGSVSPLSSSVVFHVGELSGSTL